MTTFLIVALILGSMVYVAQPVLNGSSENLEFGHQGNGQELLDQRDNLLATIKDLEFDHRMGKLSDADFADLDTRYRGQAIEALQEIDLAESTAEKQRKIKAAKQKNTKRQKNAPVAICSACGVPVGGTDNFCGACGSPLQ